MMFRFLFALLVVVGFMAPAQAGNWPAWRGPDGTGISTETGVPTTWSATENVKWKVDLPAEGNSTPIVWGDKVFVTCPLEGGKHRTLMCFARQDGRQLWSADVAYEKQESSHGTNPHCSSSPVTDGERVVVWYGSAGMYCYDLDGKEIWSKDLGEFEHVWGYASSPVIYQDLVILSAGPGINAFLIALNKKTGDEVWRRVPPTAPSAKPGEYHGSWSTPVVHREGDRDLMILGLPTMVTAFDPLTGEEVWTCGGLTKLVYTSPMVGKDAVVAMSGYGGSAVAVRTGGTGDVTETHRLWHRTQRNPQRIGSGVVLGDYLYHVEEPGIAICLEIKSGETKWTQRLDGKCWSSLSFVDGRIYAPTMSGKTYVIDPNPEECKILAENEIGDSTRSSLAFSDGQIFLRTFKHLFCLEEAKK